MTTRIVIAGGGFGGIETAFSLKGLLRPPFEITLIDKSAYHSFIPSIHLIVSGKVTAEEIRIPLKVVLGAAGIRFIQDEVLSVNTEKREVITGNSALQYDYLVLSSGAENNFFAIPGAEKFSYRFRTPDDAERIHAELVRLLADPAPCRMVLAGGGTEGVEVAGELLDLIKAQGRGEDLESGRIAVELIEGKSRLLPGFLREVQDCADQYLRHQGVTMIAGDRIAEVRKDSVVLSSGQQRDASILIWSGGIQPSKLIRGLPLLKDPWGWLKVTDLLNSYDDDRVYGIGDAVSIYADDGPLALQRLAYHAQDQARVAALNIAAAVSDRGMVSYTPKIKPQLISIGKDMGIFTLEDRVYSGPWVVSLKKAVERKHLMTYLTKPVSSAIWSNIPGAGFLQRLRTRLPV
jgi:NADH dehydrogenase